MPSCTDHNNSNKGCVKPNLICSPVNDGFFFNCMSQLSNQSKILNSTNETTQLNSQRTSKMRYFVEVTINDANDLMAKDVNGSSDPYCVVYIRDFEGNIVTPPSRKRISSLEVNDKSGEVPSVKRRSFEFINRRKSFDIKNNKLVGQVSKLSNSLQNYHDSKVGKRQTQFIKKSLNPTWNETMVLETSAHPVSDTLVIELWDYDKMTNDGM
jgi:Ca2+-dependent lipid-binding protein